MDVLVIDYGMSNLGSVRRALEELGARVRVSDDPRSLADAVKIVLPGVGSFADGMGNLKTREWLAPLRKAVLEEKIPLLGICLGMQLLAGQGTEGGRNAGLGFIGGEVKRLIPPQEDVRIPHVGWNEVQVRRSPPLFEGINSGTDFYFVHSYHFVPENLESVLATTPYCGGFVSAVGSGNVFGVQFHPEKSSRPGFHLLRNFLSI